MGPLSTRLLTLSLLIKLTFDDATMASGSITFKNASNGTLSCCILYRKCFF